MAKTENETIVRLPSVSDTPSTLDPIEGVAASRDSIFDKLVATEADIVGLLAYSLSKQNKRDWLAAFKAAKGREPNNEELDAYDIGEMIERRLTTYRKLAESALSGNAFWASTASTPVSELSFTPPTATHEQAISAPSMVDADVVRGKESWFSKKK